jgi:transcription antitermination protein NusB
VSGPRRQAREAALQILYFWEVGRTQPGAAIDAYFKEHRADADEAVVTFAATIVMGTAKEVSDLDALIAQHLRHWRIERLAVIDRSILRMAVWELRHETDTPPAVVLNEALELARRFSTDDSVAFINGVLDGIRKALETTETRPDRP